MATGIRAIQRRIVELGLDTGRVRDALVVARALGMTTYRSSGEFATRFQHAPVEQHDATATFDVETYLIHHGERYADKYTPARFLALSLSADLHTVDPKAIRTPTTLVAIEHDFIAPRWQIEQLAGGIGPHARIVTLHSDIGHDAFLTETDALSPLLNAALS
jgi:homoserine O-acetyltransferase